MNSIDITKDEPAKLKALMLARARTLRKDATDAEKLMWALLRDRQFMNIKFRRQHRVGLYIADFAATKHKLIIELDGGQHADNKQLAYDTARTKFLHAEGWQVLRFWNHDVLQNTEGVARMIADTLASHEVTLTPALSLREGEGATARVDAVVDDLIVEG